MLFDAFCNFCTFNVEDGSALEILTHTHPTIPSLSVARPEKSRGNSSPHPLGSKYQGLPRDRAKGTILNLYPALPCGTSGQKVL